MRKVYDNKDDINDGQSFYAVFRYGPDTLRPLSNSKLSVICHESRYPDLKGSIINKRLILPVIMASYSQNTTWCQYVG